MSSKFRTIDNLGIGTSIRYAEDQETLDKKLLKDSTYIHNQTEVDVSIPSYWSEFEVIFETKKRNTSWADFFLPPYFNDQKKRLFTFQILPFLGSEEVYEMHKGKISNRVKRDKKRHQEKKDKRHREGKAQNWEEEVEIEEEEKESDMLLSMIDEICFLDKILMEINARRNQYQKG